MINDFCLLITAQVPDSDEQFVPDFHSENCEYLSTCPVSTCVDVKDTVCHVFTSGKKSESLQTLYVNDHSGQSVCKDS